MTGEPSLNSDRNSDHPGSNIGGGEWKERERTRETDRESESEGVRVDPNPRHACRGLKG